MEIKSIAPLIDISRKPSYIIDWQLTFLCNLDCSYCNSHDNTTKHPDVERCKKTIDFALKYADTILSAKKPYERSVTLNLLGGESLIHPNIVEIFEYLHQVYTSLYKDRWPLRIHVVTNGVVGKNVITKCLPYIDHWVVSYHTESNAKQKAMAVETIYTIHSAGKNMTARLMFHSDPERFAECQALSDQLTKDSIKHTVRPIGTIMYEGSYLTDSTQVHRYTRPQTEYVLNYWNKKNVNQLTINDTIEVDGKHVIASAGYTCCSEKPLYVNSDRKNKVTHLPKNELKGWYCSVNWEFLFIDQTQELIYHNSSCRVNFNSEVGAIGSLDEADQLLNNISTYINTKSVPVIRCPKNRCACGICSPKAETLEDFKKIMPIHIDDSVLKY
jgi:organic radical activating enzyme